jgi:peptidoglycan/LPS O-acetylase OafA/YrhL
MTDGLDVCSTARPAPWVAKPYFPASPAQAERQPAELPLTAMAPRIGGLDAARFIAIVGVIFVHTPESSLFQRWLIAGTFGVPFYLFTALYLQVRTIHLDPHRSLLRYVWDRTRRLYVPFLAWSVIYLAARDAKHLLLTHEAVVGLSPWMLVAGTAHHLWFLPFLLFVCIAAAALNYVCERHLRLRWAVIALMGMGGLVLAIVKRPDWLNYVDGFSVAYLLWWKALPSACWGISVAWVLTLRNDLWQRIAVPAIGGALLIVMLGLQIADGYSRLDRTLSGLGLLLFATAAWRVPLLSWMSWIGRRSYGIYLTHVLFIEGMQAIAHQCGFGSSVALDAVTFAAGLGGGLAATIALQRTKRFAWLAG